MASVRSLDDLKAIACNCRFYVDSFLEEHARHIAMKNTMADVWLIIRYFAAYFKLDLLVNESVTADVIRTYSRDIDKMVFLDGVHPNVFRQAAAMALWITRLRPLHLVEHKMSQNSLEDEWLKEYINEAYGLFFAASLIVAELNKNRGAAHLHDEATFKRFLKFLRAELCFPGGARYKDLASVLKYRSVGRHSLSIIVDMLCECILEKAVRNPSGIRIDLSE